MVAGGQRGAEAVGGLVDLPLASCCDKKVSWLPGFHGSAAC